MDIIQTIEKELTPDRPINFQVGDTVRVHYKIVEGNRERIQVYEGVVIAIDNKGLKKNFTVRRVTYDIGVERIFPVYSPRIAKIDVIRKGKTRRAKLYYLRDRKGKSYKLKEKRAKMGAYEAALPSEPQAVSTETSTEKSGESKS
ncbi:MAG: 50S ribosomal protein L19 [Spirochaetes bacterium]|nr:50S ribosomal protein L19 [Spirochaetota bacterium]